MLLHIFMIVIFPIVNGYCMSLLQISIFFVVFSHIPDHQILNFYIFKLILDFIYLQGKVLYKTF